MPKDFFVSTGLQEVDDGHSDKMFSETKTPVLIKLDICDTKRVCLLNIQ